MNHPNFAVASGAPSPHALRQDCRRQQFRKAAHDRFLTRIEARCSDPLQGLAIFVVELPGLMEIGDTFGEAVRGALVEASLRSIAGQHGAGSVSCLGDDRLVVACADACADDMPALARQLQDCIAKSQSVCGVTIVGVPRIGGALRAAPAETAADAVAGMIRRAELALGHATADRAGSVLIHTPALRAKLRDATMLRQSLLRAIDQQEFTLAYQPIVDLRDQRTSGLEALIRWEPPCGLRCGGPAEFIPAAEDAGLIVAIGAQVLQAAMGQAGSWMRQGTVSPRIAVNVSGLQLLDQGFLGTVTQCLAESGLSPRMLELELTERTLIDSAGGTIRLLEHLRGLGVVISVDDFGTGYSSLRYLQDFPVSKLKIDRGFIQRLTSGARDHGVVQAMIDLATRNALDVVAEGIETPAQLAILRSLGCQSGQGFLFSRPVPASEVVGCFDRDWSSHVRAN